MTAAVILQIIAGLGGILTLWAKDYFSATSTAERKKEAENEETQRGRQDLENGNSGAVSARIDSLCGQNGGNAGIPGGTGGTGPDGTVQRLARLGIRTE